MAITYLVHDLADPAVSRRVAMLQRGGADVGLLGFHRSATPPSLVAGLMPRDLGQTKDGRFVSRILSVAMARRRLHDWAAPFRNSECIIARNLEMLYLAAAARKKHAPTVPLFYELLDIHRLMIGNGSIGGDSMAKALRSLERHLLTQCAGVIISSPAFERDYLRRHYRDLPRILLWENKVMPNMSGTVPVQAGQNDAGFPSPSMPMPPASSRPWRIGWFGAIRCRRSLLCLAEIARRHPGLIEVDIRGRLTEAMGDDFHEILASAPGLTYHGPYRYPDDLAEIYGRVHFVWAIDFYEAGFNSTWLLPNRLYEGGYCHRVPIAMNGVETGRWLVDHDLGFCLAGDVEKTAENFFLTMTPSAYDEALGKILTADPTLFCFSEETCRALVDDLSHR